MSIIATGELHMSNKLDHLPERMEQIHDANPNPILKVNYSGLIIYANASSKILLNSLSASVGNYLPSKWVKMLQSADPKDLKKRIQVKAGPLTYLVDLIAVDSDDFIYIYGTDITAFKESQKRLSESDSRYKILTENSRDLITRHDEKGTYLYVSPVSNSMLGFDPIELLGKNMFDDIHPDDIQNVIEINKNLSSKSDSYLVQYRIRKKNQEYVWVETTSKKLTNKEHDSFEIINVTRDITNRKKREKKLQEQDELYRSVITSIGEGLIITDSQSVITFVNEQIEKILGYPPEEMIGKMLELFFEPNQDETIKRHRNVHQIGEHYEIEALRKDRSKVFVDINTRPYKNTKGEITGSISAIVDITEKKEIVKHIRIQETLLNNILNNLPVNIYLKDEEGKVIFVNDSAVKTLNKPREEILNKNEYQLFPEETAKRLREDDQKVHKSRAPKIIEDNSLFGKYFLRGKIPFHIDNMGSLLLGYSIDISERKIAEEEAINAKQKAEESILSKERFISIMSHEIRTPMNAVVGITNLLLQKEHSDDQKELFRGLKLSSENLLKILNNILDLSKIDSGKLIIESADINLQEIIESVKETSSFKAAEKNILININIDKKIPSYIKGDSFRLNQILLNLLSNAVKFTEEGTITITVKLLDESNDNYHLLFIIADTGIGIPEGKLSEIFESFTQGSSDISKKYGGTGLGLTITKKLIEFQNGNIGVESTKNKGSKFIFDLTFGKSSKKTPGTTLKNSEYNFEGLKALIVEDNEMNQLVIVKFLEQQKILTKVAGNGQEALTLLKKNNFDFILMDLQMPEMDGYEASLYIREKMKNNKIPIIALTASASDDIENKVMKAGMNDYITKPFEPSILFSIIALHTGADKKKYINKEKMENSANIPKTKIIDLSYLHEASAGNKAFITEMISIFLEQTPGFINHLIETSKEKNWLEFRKTLHKIKPTIIMMGIHSLEGDVPKIENSVKKGVDLDLVPALVDKMETICKKAYEELKTELKKI
jgi:PAS domain S-box-containing protein